MSRNTIETEEAVYYKSMNMTSSGITVRVREAADYSYTDRTGNRHEQLEPAEVTIFHSPRKWDDDRFMLHLKNRAELQEYIQMLQDFEQKYGYLLDLTQNVPKE